MLQVDRRRDPYPFTWELPVGALTAVLLLFAFGVQAGRAAAYWQAGAGWRWPRGRAIVTSIPSILAGNTAAETEATLGLSRLRKQRSIIRPDLYPPRPQRRNP